MTTTENKAAWLRATGQPLEVGPAEMPIPGEGELVIEVRKPLKKDTQHGF